MPSREQLELELEELKEEYNRIDMLITTLVGSKDVPISKNRLGYIERDD